jgi:DNA replication and repair protein RecF
MLTELHVTDLRPYVTLDVDFPPGPILIVGPNASGKTSVLEAIALAARGRSTRTTVDAELVRFGADILRVEAHLGTSMEGGQGAVVEVVIVRPGAVGHESGSRKRLRVNGLARRIGSLGTWVRVVVFEPQDMLLVAGPPSLRRAMLDELARALLPGYAADLATYGRALAQRNSLLRSVREEGIDPVELRLWDEPFLDAGSRVVEQRRAILEAMADPLAGAHAEIAPDEAAPSRLSLRYETNAAPQPGESIREALRRRLTETADKEIWNGATLIGPHRDDVMFTIGGRDLAAYGSRGQQRTAILAAKLAEIDLVTERDGRPPLLLLDDVFSELDRVRRSHLVRRLTDLPQAFVTTTAPMDLDPRLVASASIYEVVTDAAGGAALHGAGIDGVLA